MQKSAIYIASSFANDVATSDDQTGFNSADHICGLLRICSGKLKSLYARSFSFYMYRWSMRTWRRWIAHIQLFYSRQQLIHVFFYSISIECIIAMIVKCCIQICVKNLHIEHARSKLLRTRTKWSEKSNIITYPVWLKYNNSAKCV